jgi:hypothetical protein
MSSSPPIFARQSGQGSPLPPGEGQGEGVRSARGLALSPAGRGRLRCAPMPSRWAALLVCCASTFALADELTLLPSSGWTDELREDLELGLASLPPNARTAAKGLEIELHSEERPLGFAYEHGRLHLYAFREDPDPRADSRLIKLTTDQRHRLWRRRAIVHAVITRLDARLRWSSRNAWKSLAGWDGDRPLLVYPWAFSRRGGMQSAALDLVTFAEELLVPAESIVPEAVALDDRLRCREPSKSRFLDERLAAIDPSWQPARQCPAFEAWAEPEKLPKFEVMFSAPSSTSAQALFGHLLLRIVRETDEDLGGAEVLQLAALVSPFEPVSTYISRGIGGGFRGVFSVTALADVHQEALGLEQRSLQRFALELTADQRLRLAERVWELERVGYIDYRFFKANCATMLRFVLAPVLGEQAPGPTLTPWETPTQVLDGLAQVLGPSQLDESSGSVARRAEEKRAASLSGNELLKDLSGTPAQRQAAYRTLSALGDETWRARVLLASLRIERAALDLATVARLKAERGSVLPGWSGPTTDELVAARQRRFEQETSFKVRAQSELADMLVLDELLRTAPRRALGRSELDAIEAEKEARATFDVVAEAVGGLSDDALSRARAEESEELRVFHEETSRRAVPEGGHGHFEAGGGAVSTGLPVLRLRAAALAERLGDQRLRGFGSRTSWKVIDATLELEPSTQPIHRAGFTLIHLQNLTLNGWGWGAGAGYLFAQRAHDAGGEGEVLRVIAGDHRFTNFLLVNAGLRASANIDQLAYFGLSPRAGLAARVQLPGSFGNAIRFEGSYLPLMRAGNGAVTFEHRAAALAQLALRMGVLGGVAFTARLDLRGEWRASGGLSGLAAIAVEID